MTQKNSIIRTQQFLVAVSVVLFIIKLVAWFLTSSVAILTDALESTVNVVASIIGLYSLILSAKPKDKEHPYGHGKVEFISSAFEGLLISVAGLMMIYEGISNIVHPHAFQKLDYGLALVAFSGLINYVVGYYCVKKGERENSPILVSGGKHLKSDTYSSIGLLAGLVLLMLTGYGWIDGAVALVFAFVIIFTGYKIIRQSVSGIMDEADDQIIEEVKVVLNEKRIPNWIDVHNMRIINYAGFYHVDCHLTLPLYYTVKEGHDYLEKLAAILSEHFKKRVEFFIHIDACEKYQCGICQVQDCAVRESAFSKKIEWTVENLISNNKHTLNS